jgi:hypothetical protein
MPNNRQTLSTTTLQTTERRSSLSVVHSLHITTLLHLNSVHREKLSIPSGCVGLPAALGGRDRLGG